MKEVMFTMGPSTNFVSDIKQFLANVPILYLLKTPENQRLPGVFMEYKMGTSAKNELSKLINFYCP